MSNTWNAKQEYQLVWSDEFDYTGAPDPNKWGYDIGRFDLTYNLIY
jgi:hypothetical protein